MAVPEQEEFGKANKSSLFFMKNFLNFEPRVDQLPVTTALREGSNRILLDKGRRWGGTKLFSAIQITYCARHPGAKTVVFGPGWDEVDVYMEQVDEHFERSTIQASVVENQKRRKKFSNGAVILAKICSPTAHGKRGRGFDMLVFTESAFIMDSQLHIVRLGKLDNPKAIEMHESSPNGLNHFHESFNDPDFVSFQMPSHLNPLISRKEMAKERAKMTKLEASQELDAEFIDDSTAPFPQVLIDEAIKSSKLDEYWKQREKDGYYVAGLDLGRKRDRSVLFIWKVEKNGHLQAVLIKQMEYNKDDPRFWSKVINSAEFHCKEFHVQILNVDCTGLGDPITIDIQNQFADHKVSTRVNGFNFTYASKNKWEGLMNQLSLKFERYEVHFPFHLEFVKQLKSIRFNSEKALFEAIGKSPDIVMAAAMGALAAPKISNFFYSKANDPVESDLYGASEEAAISYGGLD